VNRIVRREQIGAVRRFKGQTTTNVLEIIMLGWSLAFFILALIAGFLGFTGVAGAAAGIAQILFFVFLVLLILSFVIRAFRGQSVV